MVNYPRFVFSICIILVIIFLSIVLISKIKNNTREEKVVSFTDNTSTEIVLNGNQIITLYLNEKYEEPGYTAKTNDGKDITDKIKVNSNLDITTAGEYEIKYTLDNSQTTSATRTVNVKPIEVLENGEKSNNHLSVLMYHYFYSKKEGETGKNNNWMEITKFEEQLKYLQKSNYYFPTWQEVEDFVNGKIDLPKKSVVITMDDGNKSIYKYAIPLLDKYNIPATAFIITKKFDTKNLEKYKNSTIDFESHTNNMHRGGGNIGHGGIFTALSITEGVKDLKSSIEKLGGNNNALAYPYGDYTETTKQAVKQAGFKLAFTTENKKVTPGMNQYALPRVRIYSEITLNGFINSL